MGTAAVHDGCTTVGPNLTNPIITLAPGELSTWKPPISNDWAQYDNFTAGEVWNDPLTARAGYDISEGIAPLEIKDLACPTWGLGKSTSAGTVVITIGPPWLPLIIPPTQIFSLDPIWESICTGIFTDNFGYDGLHTFGLYDPPIALTPASQLAPTPIPPIPTPADPTTVPERATSYSKAAKPASLPNDPVAPPARTGDPGKESPSQSPVIASADPASSPQNSAASSKDKGDPPADPLLDPPLDPEIPPVSAVAGDASADPPSNSKVPPVSAVAGGGPADPPSNSKVPSVSAGVGNSPAESTVPSSTAPDPPSDPKVPIVPVPVPEEDPQAQAQGLGAIIYNAFGRSGPEVKASSTTSLPLQSILTIGTQTFTVNPTGFKINEVTILPGSASHTVDGTAISLGQSGILAIGSSTVSLTSPSSMTVLTVAGQTFTPNPTAFFIAGTIVSAGDSAVTVDGTIISLDPSGVLAIGSSTVDLPSLSDPPPSKVYTVAGQTFTPNPSAFRIANIIISAGGPAATINGTIISLRPSNTLLIGSSTIPLFPTHIPSDINLDGFDINSQSSFVVVDGVTLSAAAAAVTISGTLVSLEAGGATLDIGTRRFALPTATLGAANGSVNVQAFTGGESGKGTELSLALICGVCGVVSLLTS